MRPFSTDETPATFRIWANKIEVKRAGDDLLIFGTNPGNAAPKDLLQLFHDYLFAPNREREAKGPHLEFANAETDDEVIQFIKKWGPITAPSAVERGCLEKNMLSYWGPEATRHQKAAPSSEDVGTTESKRAVESLRRVRGVQAVIAAAVSLLKISHEENPDPKVALLAMNQFMAALKMAWLEFHATAEPKGAAPGWELGSSGLLVDCELIYGEAERKPAGQNGPGLTELCRNLLCVLVNRFPDNLIPTKEGVQPGPAAGHGVLPLLMFMLRQDLVNGRRIIICERCGDHLLQRRLGERACSSCKDALRAKRYYAKKRKTILRRRKRKRRLQAKMKDGIAPSVTTGANGFDPEHGVTPDDGKR